MIYFSKLECVDLWSTNCKIDLWPVDLGIDATLISLLVILVPHIDIIHEICNAPKSRHRRSMQEGWRDGLMDWNQYNPPPTLHCEWGIKVVKYIFVDSFTHSSWANDLSHTQCDIFLSLCGEERRHKWRAVEEEEASTSGPLQRGLLTWGIATAL